jgi:hypothetical protein
MPPPSLPPVHLVPGRVCVLQTHAPGGLLRHGGSCRASPCPCQVTKPRCYSESKADRCVCTPKPAAPTTDRLLFFGLWRAKLDAVASARASGGKYCFFVVGATTSDKQRRCKVGRQDPTAGFGWWRCGGWEGCEREGGVAGVG